MLKIITDGQQQAGDGGQVGAQLVVEHGKARHHEGDEEYEERHHHADQQDGVEQRCHQLLAKGERDSLEGEIA